jgi:putative phosphoesterase
MNIGIISDTHDHLDNLRKAIEFFNSRDVKHIIHAGDFCSPFTWRVFKNFKGEFTGIFGNNDGEKILLKKLYQDRIYTQPYKLNLYNRNIVIMHEPDVVNDLAKSGSFDMVVYGHTHEPEIRTVDGTLIINPGEASGWLYGKPTVAIVNLSDMKAEIISLS